VPKIGELRWWCGDQAEAVGGEDDFTSGADARRTVPSDIGGDLGRGRYSWSYRSGSAFLKLRRMSASLRGRDRGAESLGRAGSRGTEASFPFSSSTAVGVVGVSSTSSAALTISNHFVAFRLEILYGPGQSLALENASYA